MARPQHISDDTIIEALAAEGEVTAADLADRLGIGQSTAAKRLAALEGDRGGPAPAGRAGERGPGRRPLVGRRHGRRRRRRPTRYRRTATDRRQPNPR